MAFKTRRWDAADTLQSKEDVEADLDAVLEDGDTELLIAALADIARAKVMSDKPKRLPDAAPDRFRK